MSETIEIIMGPTSYDIEITLEPTQVTILANGTQGPQGPPGPSGVAYIHTQSSPSASWIVNHNLGRVVGVDTYTLLGQHVWADDSIEVVDFDTTTITFSSPTTGYAVFT
jgi:hypothetical protein